MSGNAMTREETIAYAAHEIELYAVNTGELYASLCDAQREILGYEDRGLGADAITKRMTHWLMTEAFPRYRREIGHIIQPRDQRAAAAIAAQSMVESLFDEDNLGNCEHLRHG